MDFWCKPPNEIDVSTPEYISPFEILRKFPIVPSRAQFFKHKLNNCLFSLALPVLKEILAVLQKKRSITIEQYLNLFLTSHLDSLKLFEDYVGNRKNDNMLVISLAAVRCLVSINFFIGFNENGLQFSIFKILAYEITANQGPSSWG